ncbi:MAG: arginine repressor [Oscillospiraceae bacterium]|nr:arginine repressor [Oscillospiraceae bacterium]
MKKARQKLIIELIRTSSIGNQDALQEALRLRGFPVTQATVSRDIRELNLIKRADENGVYRYVLPEQSLGNTDLLTGNILDADSAGNTVVIKCRSGTAQAVCTVLDGMVRPEVVGTLAGDDTIFVLIRTGEQARRFAAEILKKLHM